MPSSEFLEEAPLGRLVAMAGHLATRRWSAYLAEAYGITPVGAAVLMSLAAGGDLRHSELARLCAIRPATLTGVIDTLQRSGHVQRLNDAVDRRVVVVTLTDEGASVGEQLRRRATRQEANQHLTSIDSDPANAEIVRRFLIELIEKLSEMEGEE